MDNFAAMISGTLVAFAVCLVAPLIAGLVEPMRRRLAPVLERFSGRRES